eukprot:TRINITY_DN2151_c0_g1_i2.p1 TRINITY_DN2151_c0_g1~~TRINITY_DN2151_c0_g1_i2.p1  ORF type:complete len:367 (-),score=98.85 TRINITY_DN2151_c0_g1_i2:241-1341(-)
MEEEKQLDLVFIIDATGSMGSWIRSAQQNVCDIVTKITASEKADVRFGLVAFRDHPPQDSSYITKTFEFTQSLKKMKENVNSLSANGGGDFPEAVASALYDARHMKFREDAVKICVLIGDAPCHGLGCSGDGFPEGSPDGKDCFAIAQEMAEMGITIYSVCCGSRQETETFFCTMSTITGGSCVSISNASLLTDVILSGSAEEMDIEGVLKSGAQDAITKIVEENEGCDEEEIAKKVQDELKKLNVQTRQVKSSTIMDPSSIDGVKKMKCVSTIAEARHEYSKVSKRASSRSTMMSSRSMMPESSGRRSRESYSKAPQKKKKSSGVEFLKNMFTFGSPAPSSSLSSEARVSKESIAVSYIRERFVS